MIDLADFLERSYSTLSAVIPLSALEDRFDNGGQDETAREFIAHSVDGSVEVILDRHHRVTTIFVDPAKIESLPLGIEVTATPEALMQQFGPAESEGAAQDLPPLGRYGSWMRWQLPFGALHIEYLPEEPRIKRITIMTSETSR